MVTLKLYNFWVMLTKRDDLQLCFNNNVQFCKKYIIICTFKNRSTILSKMDYKIEYPGKIIIEQLSGL